MAADEIQALQLAIETARGRGWAWHPPYWVELDDEGVWDVHTESEVIVRVDAVTGRVLALDDALDPITAFSVARAYASSHSLQWKPAFSLERQRSLWVIGACQSQLGGQVHIHVNHRGEVVRHWVNPK